MKLAIHIFTIYMLALSLIPCGDSGGGIVEIFNHLSEAEHQHLSDHEQHSNDCGDDTCTPFCICNCCSSALDIPVKLPLQVEILAPVPVANPSFTPNFILSNYNSFVWQPPKFS